MAEHICLYGKEISLRCIPFYGIITNFFDAVKVKSDLEHPSMKDMWCNLLLEGPEGFWLELLRKILLLSQIRIKWKMRLKSHKIKLFYKENLRYEDKICKSNIK